MALPAKQTFTVPGAGARAVEEPKVTQSVSSSSAMQDNLYEYLDRAGATYPGALNTGLESDYIAARGVRSLNMHPQGATSIFSSTASVSPATATPTFISDQIAITTTFNNAQVLFTATAFIAGSTTLLTQAYINIEYSAVSGFAAGTGTRVSPPGVGAGNINLFSISPFSGAANVGQVPIILTDTIATAGTRYYRFTGLNAINQLSFFPARSFYTYIIFNNFA